MRRWMSATVDWRWAVGLIAALVLLDVVVVISYWSEPVNVSNNPGFSDRPALAADANGQLHMVWSDTSINYPGNSEILYRTSSDGGTTWLPATPINLSSSAESSLRPVIAVAGADRRIVAWSDNGKAFARLWNGSDWAAPFQLSSSMTPTLQLSAAINSDGIALVAWTEGYGPIATYDVENGPISRGFYRRWDGTNWSAAQPVAGGLVAMRGNLAYLAGELGTLLRSENAGQSWSTPTTLAPGYLAPDDMELDSQGVLHMAWRTRNAIRAGSYDGRSFGPLTTIASWNQLPSSEPGQSGAEAVGQALALALAVNARDQLNLLWAAPDLSRLVSTSGNYSSVPANGLYSENTFRIFSSQSLDGRTWTGPAIQAATGGFPAVAGSATGSDFYGAWRSIGRAPDVFAAVNRRPEPRYQEKFDSQGRLFIKGVDIISGTARLNSANKLDWPFVGRRQFYGPILRGQEGATTLVMLNECLATFNTTTGEVGDPNLCLPEYRSSRIVMGTPPIVVSRSLRRMGFIDGQVRGDTAYVLAESYNTLDATNVYTPHLLLMNMSTGTLKDAGQPAGLVGLNGDWSCGSLSCTQLVVDPTGQMVYLIVNGRLYSYNVATGAFADLNQSASAVIVSGDGTVYVRSGTALLSSSGGAAFVERTPTFRGTVLYADRAGNIHGLNPGSNVYSFLPASSSVVSSTTTLNSIGSLRTGAVTVTEGTDGNLYIYLQWDYGFSGGKGKLYSYNVNSRTLTNLLEGSDGAGVDIPISGEGSKGSSVVLASDNRFWMVAGPARPFNETVFSGFFAYSSDPLRGEVVSPPIFSGSGAIQWGTLTYSATVPSGASLNVDVLDAEGKLLRENVASGASLADLPAAPLRLRARMQSSSAAALPALEEWQLTWQPLDRRQATLSPTLPTSISDADGRFQLSFPAGAVESNTQLVYSEQVTPTQALGNLRFAGRSFSINASTGEGTPVRQFRSAFTLTLSYTDAELAAAGVSEEKLDLVYWDGTKWVSTKPTLDQANNRLTVSLDHLTEFALVAQSQRLTYLPLVLR